MFAFEKKQNKFNKCKNEYNKTMFPECAKKQNKIRFIMKLSQRINEFSSFPSIKRDNREAGNCTCYTFLFQHALHICDLIKSNHSFSLLTIKHIRTRKEKKHVLLK